MKNAPPVFDADLKVIVREHMGFLVYLLQENLQRAPTVLKKTEQYCISMCSISNIKHIYVTLAKQRKHGRGSSQKAPSSGLRWPRNSWPLVTRQKYTWRFAALENTVGQFQKQLGTLPKKINRILWELSEKGGRVPLIPISVYVNLSRNLFEVLKHVLQ